MALAGTLAWLWLVRWRTGRHRHPLWKSLVLPAGGVTHVLAAADDAVLPPLDNARSYRSMVQRIARQVPAGACIAAPGMARAQIVALEVPRAATASTPAATRDRARAASS